MSIQFNPHQTEQGLKKLYFPSFVSSTTFGILVETV
jgi:hypothetical protein